MPPARPRSRLRRGIAWSGAHLVATRGLAMLTRVALAGMLAPEHFGLFGMVVLGLGLLATLADFGLQGALVQRAGRGSQAYASTAFWFLAFSGAALSALAVLVGAPLLAALYAEPRLLAPAQALAVTILLSAVSTVPTALLLRQGRIGRLVLAEFAGVAMGAAAALWAASAGLGVWTLVAQQVVAAAVTAGLVWHQARWWPVWPVWPARHARHRMPAPHTPPHPLRTLMVFGWSMTGTKAVMYVRINLDNLFVGALLGATALGVYMLAFTFTEGLRSQVAAAVSRVMLPVYSRHQHDAEALRAHYLRATRVMLLVLGPLSLAVLLYAQPLCLHVLGPAWAESALPMQLLAVGGLLHAASGPSAEVLQALGRPQLLFRMAWRNLLAFALPCMAFLTWWQGVAGAACAYMLTVATQRVMLHRALHERLGLTWARLWQASAAPLALMAGVCAAAVALRSTVPLVFEAGLAASAYAVVGIRLLRR